MVNQLPRFEQTLGGATAPALFLTACLALSGCAEPPAAPAATAEPAGPAPLETDDEKASYFIGYGVTDEWRNRLGDQFDGAAFAAGLKDAVDEAIPRVDEEEGTRIMRALSEAAQADAAAQAEAQLKEGQDFLAANADKEGITVLESGLQYEVIEAGEGPKPKATDTVTTHYEGKLIDGTVFDSSLARGEPVSFALNRVIPGWTEALQLMPTGAKWRLFIPSELAYGPRPAGQIPPNSTLIFEVELISIEGADEADEG
ncbi:MAG: FKBP-type peptidyl-prolyl cis-trans isomerase [Pseudomonadota bacterium]